jgi:hypothetical protein
MSLNPPRCPALEVARYLDRLEDGRSSTRAGARRHAPWSCIIKLPNVWFGSNLASRPRGAARPQSAHPRRRDALRRRSLHNPTCRPSSCCRTLWINTHVHLRDQFTRAEGNPRHSGHSSGLSIFALASRTNFAK